LNDTLYANHDLIPNQSIRSAKNEFYARLQSNGNFVLYRSSVFEPYNAYDVNGHAVWASDTQNSGEAPRRLVMQLDGNLAIKDKNCKTTWCTGTKVL